MRVGIGYDIHRLTKGRKLVLGGVEIPHDAGLLGHSDADVLLHAVCDAMLGAAGLGDIGEHFSNTDPSYKDISSMRLLEKVMDLIVGEKYRVNNIDVVVAAEKPNISRFVGGMRGNISRILQLGPRQVNIKATTSEGVGPIGKSEAIASYAVVTLKKQR